MSDLRRVDLLHAPILLHVLMTCRIGTRRFMRMRNTAGDVPALQFEIATSSRSARDSLSSFAKPIDHRSREPSISAPRRTDGPLPTSCPGPIAAMQDRDPMPHNSEA